MDKIHGTQLSQRKRLQFVAILLPYLSVMFRGGPNREYFITQKSYTLPRHSWHYIMAPFLHIGTEELYVGTFLETNHAFFHKSWVISKPLIHEALENCRPLLVELVACGLCKSMPAIDRSCA